GWPTGFCRACTVRLPVIGDGGPWYEVGADRDVSALPGHPRRHRAALDDAHGDGWMRFLEWLEQRADAELGIRTQDFDVPELALEVEGRFGLPQLEHHVDAFDRHQALCLAVG